MSKLVLSNLTVSALNTLELMLEVSWQKRVRMIDCTIKTNILNEETTNCELHGNFRLYDDSKKFPVSAKFSLVYSHGLGQKADGSGWIPESQQSAEFIAAGRRFKVSFFSQVVIGASHVQVNEVGNKIGDIINNIGQRFDSVGSL